VSHVSEAPWVT